MLALLGFGKTNQAIAERFGPCDVYDDAIKESTIDAAGNRLYPSALFSSQEGGREIITPGIPPHHPMVKKAQNLTSEYDFFCDSMPYTIWISGTNGKTTTTEMLQHLLAPKGAICGGNIGTPLALMDPQAPIWVLETSSFTLHYTQRAKPNLYILLPITEDHLSWHGSFAAYAESKLKPVRMLRDKEVAILPKVYAATPTLGRLIPYESTRDLLEFFGIEREKITFAEPFLMDAVMALAVYKILFDQIPYEQINTFKVGAHKVEEFLDASGRLWVDDSKATNVDAALRAIERYEGRRVHLIVGGEDKGMDMEPLFLFLQGRDVCLYAIGKNAKKLEALAVKYGVSLEVCELLQEAVARIKANRTKGDVALLSPAAASLDQFSSYKERGERFRHFALL